MAEIGTKHVATLTFETCTEGDEHLADDQLELTVNLGDDREPDDDAAIWLSTVADSICLSAHQARQLAHALLAASELAERRLDYASPLAR